MTVTSDTLLCVIVHSKCFVASKVLGSLPGRQPTGYTVDVQSVDDDDDQFSCSCPTSYDTVDDNVEITMHCDSSCTLQRHRLFNMTIVAHNNAGSSRSHPEKKISKLLSKFMGCVLVNV